MKSHYNDEKRYSFDERFEWERHEQQVYNRFLRRMKRLGCAIIIITCLWSIGWIYRIMMALIE
jgi:hypothetical protein